MRYLSLLAASLLMIVPPVANAGPPVPRGLTLIHDGRLTEGIEALQADAAAHPGSRTALFYAGLGSWWRHISEFGSEKAADEAIDYFNRALTTAGGSDDAAAQFEAGTCWMLLSHMEGSRGSVLRAALHARRGKKLLEEARLRDPGNKDIGFPLGAYDYYADRLPTILKGLRALLFLPGGDSSRGIKELDDAARDGRVFSPEASLVLADIFASSLEDKYDLSVELLDRLVERHPENPFFLAGRAEVLAEVGELDLAIQDIARALSLVDEGDATLRAGFLFLEARLRDKAFETQAAVALLEALSTSARAHVPAEQFGKMRFHLGEMYERLGDGTRALAIYRELSSATLDDRYRKRVAKKLDGPLDLGPPSYRACQPAISLLRAGQAPAAEAELRRVLVRMAGDPVVLFFLAESIQAQGKGDLARPLYDEAYAASRGKHGWIEGWCLVRLGDQAAASGQREVALKRYEQAGSIESWRARGIVSYRLARVASLQRVERPSAELSNAP